MKSILLLLSLGTLVSADIILHQKEFSIKKPIESWIEIKNRNLTRQNYDYSCGSASLSTILKYYYRFNIGEKDILDAILKSKGIDLNKKKRLENQEFSLSFLDLAKFANFKGFKAIGLAIDLEALKKLKAPVILFVKIRKDEHFTIFKNIDKNYVYLADPSFGNLKVRISKFKEMFFQRDDLKYPGKILAIIPTSNEQKERIEQGFMRVHKESNLIYENIKDDLLSF